MIGIGVAITPRFVDEQHDAARQGVVIGQDNAAFSSRERFGLLERERSEYAERADARITLSAHYRAEPWPLIGAVRPRVLIDADPAYTQLWAAEEDDPAAIYGVLKEISASQDADKPLALGGPRELVAVLKRARTGSIPPKAVALLRTCLSQ